MSDLRVWPGRSSASITLRRRLPVGAEALDAGVHFRVWAPGRQRVEVLLEGGPGAGDAQALAREEHGWFSGLCGAARAGTLYRFRLDGEGPFPDPAARFQPDGPHGPSQVVDPLPFEWSDRAWRGCGLARQIVYELHVGTFTPEGTWTAAAEQLAHLAELGVTVLEVMPVADFAGAFGWGYDGVDLFAPTRLYGTPDDFRRFVDRAHGAGVGVILDVVYNHLGPDGNYLDRFAAEYFTDRYQNEWGKALDFDGPSSGPVREFFVANAVHWIDEYHLDGLRLDATQQMFDGSPEHVVAEIARAVRAAARGRATLLVAENEPQDARLARPAERGGYGLDALWNDDFHHSAMVALTGITDAYYSDYRGAPQELVAAARHGFLHQGQRSTWFARPHGSPALDLEPAAFVSFLQNHDQIANSFAGRRCGITGPPGRLRALTALLLLSPSTPLLFQGQEFGSSKPFHFFADHAPELAELVRGGRRHLHDQFSSLAHTNAPAADPCDRTTFLACKLDFSERVRNAAVLALHRDLLRLRRDDSVFRAQRPVDGAVLGANAFVLRFFGGDDGDRLLLVNLGRDLELAPAPEPLLAPPEGAPWTLAWSSEEPCYGGGGTPPPTSEASWRLPAESALVLIGRRSHCEPPRPPRGCVAQAWGVAELLRNLARTRYSSGTTVST